MIQSIVEKVLRQMGAETLRMRPYEVPIAVSARHVHLSQTDIGILFGPSYTLRKKKNLSQPNQFAAEETVTVAGPKGSLEHVRVLGPSRSFTQVEVSRTDAIKLGLKPPIRQSGNISSSSPVTVIGPKGSLYLHEGLIIAQAHIHMGHNDAELFRVKDGQYVQVKVLSERPITFDKVLIRVSTSYRLEMHIDTDEANAASIETGQTGVVLVNGEDLSQHIPLSKSYPEEKVEEGIFEGKLLSRIEVQQSLSSVIRIHKATLITPLARDTAREMGKKIEIVDG